MPLIGDLIARTLLAQSFCRPLLKPAGATGFIREPNAHPKEGMVARTICMVLEPFSLMSMKSEKGRDVNENEDKPRSGFWGGSLTRGHG